MPRPRNDEKADAMYDLYTQGFSLEQVGRAFSTTRQGVYKMFALRNFPLRKIGPLPFIFWNGEKYSIRSNGYYAKTRRGRRYLHTEVWESAHGEIPHGYDVHHVDGDPSNNAIGNLGLYTKAEHSSLHYPGNFAFQMSRFKNA